MSYVFPLEEFLQRINLQSSLTNNVDSLELIHRHMVYSIPFECFDIHLGRGINLSPAVVDNKLIRNARGGYCFELNGLLRRALTFVGFNARSLLARVHVRGEHLGRTHELLLVEIQGQQWLADVGFGGGTLRSPLALQLDAEVTSDGCTWRLKEHRLGIILQKTIDQQDWQDIYSFDLNPVDQADIDIANFFMANSAASFMVTNRVAVLPSPDGEARLLNYHCEITNKGTVEQNSFADDESYLNSLDQVFGIKIAGPYTQLKPLAQ
jgi:N-hydroxyarylamine O-acetyltransferase